MTNTPGNNWGAGDGLMRHVEFHPWASAIGKLEQASANNQEQLRDLRRAIEDVPGRIATNMDRLRSEVFQALGEADKRAAALFATQSLQIERLSQDAQRREQRQHIMFAVGVILMFVASFSARPDPEELSRTLSTAINVGAKVVETMP